MSHVFARHSKTTPPQAATGKGVYLYDADGKQYFDGSGGAAVSCLGHGDPDVIAAIQAQVAELAYAHTSFFTSAPAEELADRLVAEAPGTLEKVYFVSGGSEAVEAALKLARQYFVEKGETARRHFIARRQSYHGNTLGALATGGNVWRKQAFAPIMVDTSLISPCYAYRGQQEGESAFEYGQRVANELETELERVGPGTVIAFVAEPVVGATLGAVAPVEGYFRRIREICDKHGILLILDEVMCGMGRTGSLFAHAQEDITADIVTIAKGLGAGYQPIGAMMCTAEIHDTIAGGSGFFQHGHTYIGHPTACAAGNAVLSKLTGGLVEKCAAMGDKLQAALHSEFGQHPHIGDIRGRGLFLGLEVVEDRGTRKPFDPAKAVNKKLKQTAFANGLLCYPMGGTVDGQNGDHVLLAPPFIMEDEHVDEIVGKLKKTFDAVL